MTKAIILAAGQGQRLKPLTNDRPKGMVQVAGRSIIERQLELFRSVGITEISIVQGFCAEAIPDLGVRHYTNLDYAATNMVSSLFCAAPELEDGPVVVSYGDILYSENVLRLLLASTAPVSVVVDLEWKGYFGLRFDSPYDGAESLITDSAGNITSIGQSHPNPEDVQAQYIGLIRLDTSGLQAIRRLRDEVATSGVNIGWGRAWAKSFLTDLLQELVRRGIRVSSVPIQGEWCEVDSLRDFVLAEQRILGFTRGEPRP